MRPSEAMRAGALPCKASNAERERDFPQGKSTRAHKQLLFLHFDFVDTVIFLNTLRPRQRP